MILTNDAAEAKRLMIGKILDEGFKCSSRFGNDLRTKPAFLVVKKPEYFQDVISFDYRICGESYYSRFEPYAEIAANKLKETPYTRRVSIPLWRARDYNCHTPPAITELSFLVDESLHITAYLRSLDCLNYFEANFDFILYTLEKIADLTGFETGSVAMLIGVPHLYERDVTRAKQEAEYRSEKFGYNDFGTHIVEDYISSAWHSALEVIYTEGKKKRTEWGEVFEGQEESLFVHRLFIEVEKPEENKMHDKAPFTESYGIDYAHNYVMHAACIDRPVENPILKEGEEYTYAERARHCEKDDVKVDQLYESVKRLADRCRRDCYVGISRPDDLLSSDPPCLRGYQFMDCRGLLNGVFYMRSNDAYGAMHANMYGFALLTKYISEMAGFEGYRYNHFVVDAHIYAEFTDAVREILQPESPSFSDFIQ
jgi:thymidylate synthase